MSSKVALTGNKQVIQKIKVVNNGIKNPKVALKRIGIKILNEVNKNFQRGGNDGVAWEANAPATIARKGSSRPLIDTGNLRGSFTFQVRNNNQVQIGSPVFYSEFHEFGVAGKIPQRKMLPKDASAAKIAKQEVQRYLLELTKKPV
tara:strand:+ start:1379 stop:1816 length:438 start_codon:yes stop_codon:yes gene_type:complete